MKVSYIFIIELYEKISYIRKSEIEEIFKYLKYLILIIIIT